MLLNLPFKMGFLCSSRFQNPHMPKHFTYSFASLCLTMGNHSSQIKYFLVLSIGSKWCACRCIQPYFFTFWKQVVCVQMCSTLIFHFLKASGVCADVFISINGVVWNKVTSFGNMRDVVCVWSLECSVIRWTLVTNGRICLARG